MNTPDFEQSALTALALGELSPSEAAAVRRAIAASPEIRAEHERIEQTVAAMRNAPAIPRRTLTQRQRETVLAMGRAPSRGPRVIPISQGRVRTPSALMSFAKFAAAACFAIGAFMLGQKYAPRAGEKVAVIDSAEETTSPLKEASPAPRVAETPETPAKSVGEAPGVEAATFEAVQQPPRVAPVMVVEAGPSAVAAPPVPEPAPAAPPIASRPVAPAVNSLKSFTMVSAQPESMIVLQPQLLRVPVKPVPREFAGQLLAAPIQEKPRGAAKPPVSRKPERQPQLVIHSWKAEIASCPWDTSRRLMRFVAQIPVDQDGIETNARDYQISVMFDPNQVQAWRLVMEKHMPPTNGSPLATRFAWYEIVPGRNFAPKTNKPAAIGTLDIIQPRGAAHDGQPLKLLDRGLAWNEKGDDFIFETAMVGFSLLLQGRENIGHLDHKLVLDLASQSRDDDPKGECGKFITAVKQAQKAAGL